MLHESTACQSWLVFWDTMYMPTAIMGGQHDGLLISGSLPIISTLRICSLANDLCSVLFQ